MKGCGENININETFIIASNEITPVSPCSAVTTNYIYNCDDNLVIDFSSTTITPHVDIVPYIDNNINLGLPSRRFRDINTISGTSSVWTSTNSVTTPNLILGLDSSGNTRTITADNSVIQNDTLFGGTY